VPAIPALDELSPEWAWGQATGAGVRVAIIDSGVDARHPSLPRGVQGYATIEQQGSNWTVTGRPHEDVFGHGTACAGIVRSLAPECDIYSVRVLGPRLRGSGDAFVAGLRWALENGMDVCNLSLGTTRREHAEVLRELADEAYFRGIVLVTAANNLPVVSFPSLLSAVISVAAHESPDRELYYYNPAPPVEFGAPGINVEVLSPGGGTLVATGNSYAAPHITGLVARLLGSHPGLTVFQVKTVLRALAANIARPGG
jgi:subtilisin family serine protease